MAKFDKVKVIGILTYLVILVTMVYGPIAAMLVEMFPTRIRYTSMSCRTTSATAGSAACCPPRRLPSWRRPVTCTTVVVPDHRRRHDLCDRHVVRQGNQGR
jgi:hypothetical protein